VRSEPYFGEWSTPGQDGLRVELDEKVRSGLIVGGKSYLGTIVCGLHGTRLWQEVGRWLNKLGEQVGDT